MLNLVSRLRSPALNACRAPQRRNYSSALTAFDEYRQKKNISELADLYNQKVTDIIATKEIAKEIESRNKSLIEALQAAYPSHAFELDRFTSPNTQWQDKNVRRKYLDSVARILAIRRPAEWYKFRNSDVVALGGSPLLQEYFNSLSKLLIDTYPEHTWLEWRFAELPPSYWKNTANWRRFLVHAASQLGYSTMDGWYQVNAGSIKRLGGEGLIMEAGNVFSALSTAFPEHFFELWRFQSPTAIPKVSKTILHKGFFDHLAQKLNFKNLDDWYQCDTSILHQNGAASILTAHYDHSLSQALQKIYPEHEWLPWKFKRIPSGFWKSIENQRRYFDWVGSQLGVRQMEDWYNIYGSTVSQLRGVTLMSKKYRENLFYALSSVYPEHPWEEWRFKQTTRGYWHDKKNQREFLEQQAPTLNVAQLSDWYSVPASAVFKLGGSTLLRIYKGSMQSLLTAVFPEHEWLPWKFYRINANWWSELSHQKLFLEWAASQLGVKQLEDWYSINISQIIALDGTGLISRYGDSLQRALAANFPDHTWASYKFTQAQGGWWSSAENRRACLIAVGKSLGVKKLDDWYNITVSDLITTDISTVIVHVYGSSLYNCMQDLYPEFKWRPWRFRQVPQRYWIDQAASPDRESLSEYVSELEKKLGIKEPLEWYRVSDKSVMQVGLSHVVKPFGSLAGLLGVVYPNIDWNRSKFSASAKKSMQLTLVQRVQELFPGSALNEDAKVSLPGGQTFELDVLLPQLSIAFELQGEQHFEDVRRVETVQLSEAIDLNKAAACIKAGISLIQVRYDWDGSKETLTKLVLESRPDLSSSLASKSAPTAS